MNSEKYWENTDKLALICTQWFEVFELYVSRKDALEYMRSDEKCFNYLEFLTNDNQVDTSITCERFASRKDLMLFYKSTNSEYYDHEFHSVRNKKIDFINEITQKHLPKILLFTDVDPDYGACGDDDSIDGFIINLYLPKISLKTVVIENISNESISIDAIEFKELRKGYHSYLREPSYNKSLFDETESELIKGEEFFGPKYLKPNEKIAIPLHLFLETKEERKYVFGPALNFEKIYFNGFQHSFRQENPKRFSLYYDEGGIGSCPFVYTKSSKSKSNGWIVEAEIIHGQNGINRFRYDTIQLKNFDGSILIKEVDREESYIDYLELIIESNSDTISINPNDNLVSKADETFLVLRTGDSKEVKFNIQKSDLKNYNTIKLVSKGYYSIYKRKKLDTTQHIRQ